MLRVTIINGEQHELHDLDDVEEIIRDPGEHTDIMLQKIHTSRIPSLETQ